VSKIRIIGKGNSVQHDTSSYKTISNQMFSHHKTKLKEITDRFLTQIYGTSTTGTIYKTYQEQQKAKNIGTAKYNTCTRGY